MTNYFASGEIFYRRFFLPTKFYADFFSSDKVYIPKPAFMGAIVLLYFYIASALIWSIFFCKCHIYIALSSCVINVVVKALCEAM